jgi:hypothetical protein
MCTQSKFRNLECYSGLSCVKLQCRGKDGPGSFNKSVSKSLSAALFEGEDNLLSKGIILLINQPV